MIVRIHRYRTYLIAAILVNLIVFVYLAFKQHMQDGSQTRQTLDRKAAKYTKIQENSQFSLENFNNVTVVIREFEDFENEIVNTVFKIQQTFPSISVVVIGDKQPYPPLKSNKLHKNRFHFISLEGNLWESLSSSRPESVINTEYIFLVPDGTALQDANIFKSLVKVFKQSSATMLAVRFEGVQVFCAPVFFSVKEWALHYLSSSDSSCNNVVGEHGVFMKTQTFFQVSQPYLRPLPMSLYIQGSVRKWTTQIVDVVSLTFHGHLFQVDAHNKWKHKHFHEQRIENMNRQLGIKLVQQGKLRRQWYGCSKRSERCFDTVIDDMPEYLFKNRWTPPCCLKALRETAKHVFGILDSCGSRYWLEGGSLLGAARQGDIIPWDYDVDVGIYLEDVSKCEYLQSCTEESYVDDEGFVCEKAREGDFYRVQYSESNRLHVDIFPFYSRNGTVTKNTWIKSHRQDTEFPEHYLKPLTKIKFVGMNVNAPNNIKQFLEFKFGPGVIENPKYPNAQDPV